MPEPMRNWGLISSQYSDEERDDLVAALESMFDALDSAEKALGAGAFEYLRDQLAYAAKWRGLDVPRVGRRTIGKVTRQLVMARDYHRCAACGAEQDLVVDHIVAVAPGGSSRLWNLQTLCAHCNCVKGDR